MSSTLDDARASLLASTRGWLRYNWREQASTWWEAVAIGIWALILLAALTVATLVQPVALLFGWIVRRKARRECERLGAEWRR